MTLMQHTSRPRPGGDSRQGPSLLFVSILRIVFVLALCSVGATLVSSPDSVTITSTWGGYYEDLVFLAFIGLAIIVIALDIFIPRKSLTAISGLFFGLVVGMVVAYGLTLIVDLVVLSAFPQVVMDEVRLARPNVTVNSIKLALGVICCYLAVSFIIQTKDDIRFVIPYVEFAKQSKGAKPLVLDTSVIIDGRIADIAETQIFDTELIIPRFVLQELQAIADSSDKLRRTRGRRGLDMLNKLQTNNKIDICILDVIGEGVPVDEMLVDLAVELGGKVVTNDYNLNKIAQLRGVGVININDLANALKPVVLPGEMMTVKVIKPGEELGQGVGYLDDGTMVVAEGGRDHIGDMVDLTVTSVLQTSAGRMIFGRIDAGGPADHHRPRPGRAPAPSGH